MTFEGWDEMNPYDISTMETGAGWISTVTKNGEPVFNTRACRLKVQAETLAIDWVQQGKQGGVILDVQNLSVDADFLFSNNRSI